MAKKAPAKKAPAKKAVAKKTVAKVVEKKAKPLKKVDTSAYDVPFKVNLGDKNKTVKGKFAFKRFGHNYMFHAGTEEGTITVSEFGTGQNVCTKQNFRGEFAAIAGTKTVLRGLGTIEARKLLMAAKVINTGEFNRDETLKDPNKKEEPKEVKSKQKDRKGVTVAKKKAPAKKAVVKKKA